ncbi:MULTISPECIES: hypothetical protein [Flavobacterium]|uniref:Uncharacterized protein n=1 Tax=Flavobacterium suzhouense TaxID=1529638 RepID=A0ABW5NS42_9FLAO|nr:hypothetical protein [Flavobacterium sp. AG291]RDI11182.1 hypothetical protein DEU42_106116 [Flavobacterium sp. AG291]
MKKWVKYGLLQGALMAFGLAIAFPILDGTFSTTNLVIGIPVFILSGLVWGYLMLGKQPKKLYNEKMG